MGVDVTEQRDAAEPAGKPADAGRQEGPSQPAPSRVGRLNLWWSDTVAGLRTLDWVAVVLLGIAAGVLMPLTLVVGGALQFFAGLVPVGAGLFIGRRAKSHYTLHGFVVGLIAAIVAMVFLGVLIFMTPLGAALTAQSTLDPAAGPQSLGSILLQFGGFIAFSLLTFCTFGASMAGRAQERNRQMRREVDERGGSLEKAGAIRTRDDLRGLSLPQMGGYVNSLFKKQGFTFKDYRFVDKDRHLDLWYEREGERWHVRATVMDKVGPGTIEGLHQRMKEEGCHKGVVITSTEFTPTAEKSAQGRPIVLVDGTTLFQIAEG